VRGHAVEEPAVVADHDGAAREGQQAVLQRAQRVDVEVVRRFVQQQHVAAATEHLGQQHAVPFPTREPSDLLLLVAALEAEAGHIGTGVQLAAPDDQAIRTTGDLLEDGCLTRQGLSGLVDVGEDHARPDRQRPVVRLLFTDDHPEQRRLPRTVRTDDADDAAARQRKGETVDEQAVAVRLDDAVGLDDLVPQAGACGDASSTPSARRFAASASATRSL
jgi:hypothetical protein